MSYILWTHSAFLQFQAFGFVVARSAVSKSSRHVSAGAEGGGIQKRL